MASNPSVIQTMQAPPDEGAAAASTPTADLLITLTSLPAEALPAALANLQNAFPESGNILVATPATANSAATSDSAGALRLLPYTAATSTLFLTATDYLNTFKFAQEHESRACILLGPESQSLHPEFLQQLSAAVLGSPPPDLVLPRYQLSRNHGLINSAILYPVTRALFGARARFPQAIDVGISLRMAERLATVAQRYTAAGQNDAIVWPVAEAVAANWTITEIDVGPRGLPQPETADLNALLAQIAGSFFADIEAKASVWQRVRPVPAVTPSAPATPQEEGLPDVTPMLQAFRVAYSNLQEVWALVLPPQSLLGLKHLSRMQPADFRMSDELWTRIVYDFILAYRLRTINRGHLLGALTPLYLAWVASHVILSSTSTAHEQHIEDLATAFEYDKGYLVSRWRWPDRFNP